MISYPDWLNSREFYELMQNYRHAQWADAAAAFEAVKTYIRNERLIKRALDEESSDEESSPEDPLVS